MIFAILAVLTANSATLPATMRAAKCGDVITLQAGDYGIAQLPRLACKGNGRLRIEAGKATIGGVVIRGASGVEWHGGRITGVGAPNAAVVIDNSSFVTFADALVTGSKVAIHAVRSTDVEIVGNSLDGYRSDGVNYTMIQRLRIAYNQMRNMDPIRATYDPAGKLLVDGDHADCIQGWSTKGTPPVADVTIEHNTCRGVSQGITIFNAGQGGVDRIVIRNNLVEVSFWHGITVTEGRGTVIRDNVVRTVPGATAWNFPYKPVRTWISTSGGSDQIVCGNVVPAMPGGEGTKPC